MKRLQFSIIVLILAGVLFGCQQRMTVIKARLVEKGPYPKAVAETKVGMGEPAFRHYSNGLALLAAGDTLGSTRQFHLAVATDSTVWPAHYMLGQLASASEPDDCLDHYRTTLRFAPQNDSLRSEIYVAIASCYERHAALAYAEQNFRTALKLDSLSLSAQRGLQRIMARRQAAQ